MICFLDEVMRDSNIGASDFINVSHYLLKFSPMSTSVTNLTDEYVSVDHLMQKRVDYITTSSILEHIDVHLELNTETKTTKLGLSS